MFDKERILYQIERTRVLTLQLVERVPHEAWFTMPMDISHVAWNVGHIATADYFLGMVFVRGVRDEDTRFIPENYVDLFGYNSVPQADPALYPSPMEMLDTLDAVHQQLLREARAMPESEFNEPCLFPEGEFDHHPIFEDKGGSLEWIAYHEHMHMGTIGLLRRELGAEPIQYFEESRGGRRFK